MEPLALTRSLLDSVLVDETADNTNDLYIRSVCFSPDGKLLATGAEDKTIRVSYHRHHHSESNSQLLAL